MILLLAVACTSQRGLKDSESADPDVPVVYNPKTGMYEPVSDPMTLIDTVKWEPKEDAAEPIGKVTRKSEKKDVYSVAFLMPFAADGKLLGNRIDAKTRRFLNYYGGVKIALDDLASQGIKIDATVIDTREEPQHVAELLEDMADVDLIIGPYDRDCLQAAASFASKYQIPVVSPWTPSIIPEASSEYFVQIVPGLQTHAEAAMRYAATHFDSAKFFLVANPETSDHARMTTYNEAFERYMPEKGPLEKLVVDQIAMGPDSNDLTTVYHPEVTNVFVMPYYLRSEQEFVNAFLRKIHAEHGEVPVAVIGLPQWMQFTNVNPDYLEGLNTHVTAVQFVDMSRPEVRAFSKRYFDAYAGVPEQAAWRGYDLTTFLGHNLHRYGTMFLSEMPAETGGDLKLSPVYEAGTDLETKGPVRFIENRGIAILVFEDQQFKRVE